MKLAALLGLLGSIFPARQPCLGQDKCGIQCDAPVRWKKIYVHGNVSIKAQISLHSHPLSMGQRFSKPDLSLQEGDLRTMPAGV